MSERTVVVSAFWDAEASVWVAESDDVPGLITEADSVDALLAKLRTLIPELIEENEGAVQLPEVPFELMLRELRAARRQDA